MEKYRKSQKEVRNENAQKNSSLRKKTCLVPRCQNNIIAAIRKQRPSASTLERRGEALAPQQ